MEKRKISYMKKLYQNVGQELIEVITANICPGCRFSANQGYNDEKWCRRDFSDVIISGECMFYCPYKQEEKNV